MTNRVVYPYENLLLQTMKGEVWKDVPNYEGSYKVSSFGRVKSLDRVVPHPRLYQQTVFGRVLKQKVMKNFNRITGDDMVSLQVAFTIEGRPHYHNVRRLVYAAFKKKINYSKDGLYVINKDGNGYNNRLSNLVLVTRSVKQRRSIDSGRQDFKYFKTIDRSQWKKNYSRRIAISQYTPDGKLVRKYKSIREAHEVTGFDSKSISQAAKGFYKGKWRGYKWKFLKHTG